MQPGPQSTKMTHLPANPSVLDEEDVRRLMEDSTPAARLHVTDKIAASYKVRNLDSHALIAAEQVFRLLLQDTELRVRVTLAQHLKESPHIPRDIVKALARDVEEVSLPVLQFSEVLNDNDLLELLGASKEISRYLAISKRKHVSETVSQTLIEQGNAEVASNLVNNKGAQISEAGLNLLIEKHQHDETLMQNVGERAQLPVAVVEKLVSVVSSALGETLRSKYKMPGDQLARELESTHEEHTLNLIGFADSEHEADKLINQLRSANNLSPSLILSALCQGSFAFFELALAKLSNIPLANARKLIGDRGDLGFRAIYNKAGLPEGLFLAVKLLLQVVRELDGEGIKMGTPKYANLVIERVLKSSETNPVDNLSYVIALVRRVAR